MDQTNTLNTAPPPRDDITGSGEGVYLDGEEGNVVKLFDKTSDLSTVLIVVEPRTPLNLHLRDTPEVNTPGVKDNYT